MRKVIVKAISEFAEVITGGTPSTRKPEYWGGDVPWLNSGVLNDGDIKAPSKYITELGLKNSSAKLMPKNTVLIALTGATTGQIGYLSFEASANQSVTGILPSKEHQPRYLYYFLKSRRAEIKGDAFGGAQPHINQKYVKDFKIPLPSLDDQKRIALLLGKIEGLIAQRKQHLQQLDDLLKSVFLDMFGDPVRNEKGWKKRPFDNLLLGIESGSSPKCEARVAEQGEWGILKLGAVTSCVFKEGENKALPQDVEPQTRDEVRKGDLLFSRKNTYELVAACVYVFDTRPKLLLPDLIFRFVFKNDAKINPIYMWKLLTSSSQRTKIQTLASGAAGSMPNISKANLRKASLPIPPLELQNQFAAIVEKVEGLKSRYQQSLSDLQNVYDALSQKAFKGELDLSQVFLPKEK